MTSDTEYNNQMPATEPIQIKKQRGDSPPILTPPVENPVAILYFNMRKKSVDKLNVKLTPC